MNRVLVTGGAGFLGSHLCERLLEDGYEVICVDNFYTGSKTNIKKLLDNSYFELIRHDITFPLFLEIDQIYNLACPASPVHYQFDPVQTIKTSVHGAINMLDLSKSTKARILQASTSEVYGNPEIHPQTEDYWGNVNPVGPRGVYDEAKRFAEAMTVAYGRYHEMDTRVVRIFNTYGPQMRPDDGRVVSNFIVQALKEEPLTIYGKGEQTRSFCYVDDLVEGILRLLEADRSGETALPFNIGNPRERTVEELAQRILSLTGSRSEIEAHPLPEDDPRVRCPDIGRARRILDWEPRVDIDEGLTRTIDYFRNVLLNLPDDQAS